MASLKLSHIYKVYDNGHKAVNDFSIDIEDKEFIVFVGPSGCGKSTTLRMIAGLEAITAGDLFIEDTLVNDMEPKDRNIAMVFQNYALYPHMTVYENMAFGLRNKHIDKEIIDQKVKEAAKILDITEYLDRKPKAMSGGQRQRVALGRAIVRDPKVFLLDEPLSNLDAKLRAQMRTEITKLHKKLGTTFIYVTHDQIEAMTMGTRIVVMKLGYVQQIDTPMNLYDKPHNAFVGGFIGTPQMNFFDVKLLRNKEKVFMEFVNGEKIVIPFEKVCKISESYLSGNKKVLFGIRPEHLSLSDDKKGIGCIVSTIERLGNETLIYGDLEDDNQEFTMADTGKRIVTKVFANPDIKVGEKIFLKVDFNHAHYFDGENEEAVTLVEDIPLYSEATLDIKKNNGRVFGNEVKLPEELLNRVNELNEVTLKIPPSSVVKGKDFSLKVLKIEKIGDKNLAYLDNNGHILFALVDSSVKEKSMYSFSLLLDEIDFLNGDVSLLTRLDKNVKFVGKFVKKEIKENRERIYHFFANIKNANFEIKQSDGYKMNAIEGNKCYNKSYRYEIDRDEITLLNEADMPVIEENKKKKNYEAFGIEATFVREIRYGYKKYNEVCIGENENIIINDFGLKEGDVVHLTFNGEKASIFSIDNDIKII